MEDQLLVRMYNVGLGDCIYLRVPDHNKRVHILIDCGNKYSQGKLLAECIAKLKTELPTVDGKPHLDLLVVSHPHEDHHKGFEEASFFDMKIDHIWISPAYDKDNPEAQAFRALRAAAKRAVDGLAKSAAGELKDEIESLRLSLDKDEAIEMLCHNLAKHNNIFPPLYVSANTPPEKLKLFDDPDIELKVLGPMGDIDRYYLGGQGLFNALSEAAPSSMADGYGTLFLESETVEVTPPRNISTQDFKRLRGHIQANAMAVAVEAGKVVNNLSVVLLLIWHGRRLLFPGDAEWNEAAKSEVRDGKGNGSWNVMWQEHRADFSKPLDFLKIGHHGSENATPWTEKRSMAGEEHPINQILDAMLPKPPAGQTPTAQAVASTDRTNAYPSIPDAALMTELGRRVANARTVYREISTSDKRLKDFTPQPQRTDLEHQATDTPENAVEYIEVCFSPKVGNST